MMKYQYPERDLSQTKETAGVEFLEGIENLRTLLYRFIPLLNSEFIETRTQSTLVLEKMHREIRPILASRHFRKGQDQLECWENEGGRIGYGLE